MHRDRRPGFARFFLGLVTAWLVAALPASALEGRVQAPDGSGVVGVMVTAERGEPARGVTVYSDGDGRYQIPGLTQGAWEVRTRRIGWRDQSARVAVPGAPLDLTLERESDPVKVAAQLPANRWFGLVLEQIDDPAEREQFVRQCTYCHQQGNSATRVPREDWQWKKVLSLMARMGGGLSPEVRAQVPGWFRTAYDPATAVPRLTAGMGTEAFEPPPSPTVRRAVIDEWVLGGRSSMQHDLAVHPNGDVYSVDMNHDALFRLDPETGERWTYPIDDAGMPLGGLAAGSPITANASARVGPHSLQFAADGTIWVGRFDLATEEWTLFPLTEGIYPHTLRIDQAGRVWFTIAGSNHLGRFDPATERYDIVRLPADTYAQALMLRLIPAFLWLSERVDLSGPAGESSGAGAFPVPYGIDIAPDGQVWFSQLNQHNIGRIDPETLEVELVDTPFTAPRRLRFDSKGRLWIPGFSSNLVARFDPETRAFETWELPIEPLGTETPYALHVDRRSDTVWICGTNSDSLIRFEPASERFDIYPLPTRVSYTRDIDFDAAGRVWTSNSNAPTWQIERGQPRVIRLDPRDADEVAAAR
jgi:streptogramin lyase